MSGRGECINAYKIDAGDKGNDNPRRFRLGRDATTQGTRVGIPKRQPQLATTQINRSIKKCMKEAVDSY